MGVDGATPISQDGHGRGSDGDGSAGRAAVGGVATRVPGLISSTITRELVKLYREQLGRGPTKARTTANVNTVTVSFEDTLTTAELTLIRTGKDQQVVSMRQALADTMRADAIQVIEELVNRRVRAYVSGLDTDANVAVQVFLLEDIPETGELGVSEVSIDGEVENLT